MATGKIDTQTCRIKTIAERTSEIIASCPPLTDEQAARIASLLRPYGGVA